VAVGFAALAVTRRAARGHIASRRGAFFELDPLGPADGASDALELSQELTPRNEAEALAGVGIAWPLMPPSWAEDLPVNGEVPGYDQLNPAEEPDTSGVSSAPRERSGFSHVDVIADFDEIDLDIDFDDADEDVSTERGLTVNLMEQPLQTIEAYDAILPEDLGSEWLARATEAPRTALEPIDDIAEIPVESQPVVSEGSELAGEGLSDEAIDRARRVSHDDVEVPNDLWDAFERTRR